MNQATTELLEKIKRIQALAKDGVGGEKESAQTALNRLMQKYDISESEIADVTTELEWFRYKNSNEDRLLSQILYMVTGNTEMWSKQDKRYKVTGCYCTKAQKVEIQANFDFFNRALESELGVFMDAFMQKNKLFPPKSSEKVRKIDKERAVKVGLMMEGMDRYTRLKEIAGGEK